jgi:hypothetical protein
MVPCGLAFWDGIEVVKNAAAFRACILIGLVRQSYVPTVEYLFTFASLVVKLAHLEHVKTRSNKGASVIRGISTCPVTTSFLLRVPETVHGSTIVFRLHTRAMLAKVYRQANGYAAHDGNQSHPLKECLIQHNNYIIKLASR